MKSPHRATTAAAAASALPLALLVLSTIALGACRQDMHDAPRYESYEASTFFADGRSSRTAPAGTVARGWLREDEALYTGKVNGQTVDAIPFEITHADVKRGQERFSIYCTPCHGQLGDGNGMVVQRGLRQAANFHQDRLRLERIGYFYDVVTNGFGAMQGYAEQVPVRDRWLIAAYVRALQLSQNARIEDVPAEQRGTLGGTAR
jgi:mono/diheme cytochrome c family protein